MKTPFNFDQTTLDADQPLPALVVAYAIAVGVASCILILSEFWK